jgi:UDPglucose 6-dehydrogenase
MKVGFVGLGKLGLPCALAIAEHHDILGYDKDQRIQDFLVTKQYPHMEEGVQERLQTTTLRCGTLREVVQHAEVLFVAVQTPHHPDYEGKTIVPEDRKDFDYSILIECIQSINTLAVELNKKLVLVVISTVLPGTMDREVLPLLDMGCVKLVYNPFFIAMGTTIHDFLNPEFILFGCNDTGWEVVDRLYRTVGIFKPKEVVVSIREAELIKVAYNTFIGLKIIFANTLMEICDRMGMNVDHVTDALGRATDRLISTKYLRGGMGDGGGCHPRDNIALSHLARMLGLSVDPFDFVIRAREAQTAYLAEVIHEVVEAQPSLPIVILGQAFKPGTNITVGSPALLLEQFLRLRLGTHPIYCYDPYIAWTNYDVLSHPAIFFIATNHEVFKTYRFPDHSVVIDPWGVEFERLSPSVAIRRIGR